MFSDLPLDLLPSIVRHIPVKLLPKFCLVSKNFYAASIPNLFNHIAIYAWHKDPDTKVSRIFKTLATYPRLAKHVRVMEIRHFPKHGDLDLLHQQVLRGISNCLNLLACTWTRDGTLDSEILTALQSLPLLEILEINGHNTGASYYNPTLLPHFSRLRKLTLIMPSSPVVAVLSPWICNVRYSLRNLTLICKSSPLVTDPLLKQLAPDLCYLDHLSITGCPKVTQEGILEVIRGNVDGLKGLALEGLSPRFTWGPFAQETIQRAFLKKLRSITLTINDQKTWPEAVLLLLSGCHSLQSLQVYATERLKALDAEFWSRVIDILGTRLIRLSIHRMGIHLKAIEDICIRCAALEELFIVVEHGSLDLVLLGESISKAENLKTLHINGVLDPFNDRRLLLEIVKKCPTLTQFGCNTKVWNVIKTVSINPKNGLQELNAELCAYTGIGIPEPFLVVRI
ncbi:hypothetical protein C8J56DRAFT_435686 [Mycena floridula]|nr:hypothetical protein C8J56DRAFT_435686 [Mycena floridula]